MTEYYLVVQICLFCLPNIYILCFCIANQFGVECHFDITNHDVFKRKVAQYIFIACTYIKEVVTFHVYITYCNIVAS